MQEGGQSDKEDSLQWLLETESSELPSVERLSLTALHSEATEDC